MAVDNARMHALVRLGIPRQAARLLADTAQYPASTATDFGEVGDISTQAFGDAPAAGTSGEVADAAHKHGMPRIVRGIVNADGTVAAGSGFTAAKTATGKYTVTITSAFAAPPVVVLTAKGGTAYLIYLVTVAADSFTLETSTTGAFTDTPFHFAALEA